MHVFGVLVSWTVLGMIYGGSIAFAYLVGYARGSHRATKRLRRRLMLAGSQFAGRDE